MQPSDQCRGSGESSSDAIRVLHVDGRESAPRTADALERADEKLAVRTVTSAADALDRLGTTTPDCVVGGDLPDRGVLAFLREVRERHGDLPFVVFGDGEPEVAGEAIDAGAVDYLPRDAPAAIERLAHRIRAAVERSRAERGLDRYRAFLERSADLVSVLDEDGTYLYVSPTYRRHTGRGPADLEGRNGFEFVHPDDRAAVREEFEAAIADPGGFYTAEYRYRHADGEWRWHESVANNQLDNDAVGGIIVNTRDVTGRKRHELRLRRERDRFATLFDNLPSPVLHARAEDGEPVVRDVNTAFEEVFGVDGEAIRGEPLHDFLEPTDGDDSEPLYERVLETGRLQTEIRRRTVGGPRDFQLDVVVRSDSDPLEGYAIYTDVTDRKRRERELERQNERLEEFASVVSHDLRNPLNVIQGSLDMLAADGSDADLDRCRRAADRMETLIQDLLALARGTIPVEEAETEAVRLPELVEECRRTVDTADATLRVRTDRAVTADRERLRQVFENLLRNAVEHGGDDVTITVDDCESGFFVADDGPGVPPDERDRVFERGYSTSTEGTGFGLNIVAGIADAHGWDVDVIESRDGGARFEITGVDVAD